MFNMLQNIALGVVGFAVLVTIGVVIIQRLGNAVGGTGNDTAAYIQGALGQNNGGLASWTYAVIAIVIGIGIFSYFSGTSRGKR